jgi:hypothetical protein
LIGQRGICLLNSSLGMPVLQALGETMVSWVGLPRTWDDRDSSSFMIKYLDVPRRPLERREVTEESRLSFERAWGMPPDQQLALEREIRTWCPLLVGAVRAAPSVLQSKGRLSLF